MCGSIVDIQSATAEIRRGIKKIKEEEEEEEELECGPMPNLMAALPNIGGALCSVFSGYSSPARPPGCWFRKKERLNIFYSCYSSMVIKATPY